MWGRTCRRLKVNDQDQVAAKTAHAQRLHEVQLLQIGVHAQEAQCLTFARLAGRHDVQPRDGTERFAEGLQGQPQGVDVGAIFQ